MKREEPEKSHKQHRHKKDKVEKKLNYKKHKNREKEKRKAEKDSKKETPEEAIQRNIHIIVKKLLKYDKSSEQNLPELLGSIDKGNEIDIGKMDDEYARHKLYKLFKLLGIQQNRAKYAFKLLKTSSTAPKWKNKTFKEKIIEIISEAKKEIEESKKSEKAEKDENSDLEKDESDSEKSEKSESEKSESEKSEKNEGIVGPTIPEVPQKKKITEKEEPKGQSFLQNTMKVIEGTTENDDFVGPMAPDEIQDAKYAKKKELLAEYNKIFRPKTLLEEHQEKLGKMKQSDLLKSKVDRIREVMEKPFDREKDLEIETIHSKDAFKALQGGGSLQNKFGSSHFLHDQK